MGNNQGLGPICFSCKHFYGIKPSIGFTCGAFGHSTPIPIEIMVSSADHQKPFNGDNGITFSPLNDKARDVVLATDPPESEAQRKAMFAAASGHSTIGIPESVGEEFAETDPGGKLPRHVKDMSGKDMSGGDWRGLIRGLIRFFWEESQEAEHQPSPSPDGIILDNDECVKQVRNWLGEFRRGGKQTARDVYSDPDRRVYDDSRLAHDELDPCFLHLASDREATRTKDDVGRMHVKDTVLSKAVVSPYLGKEINEVMKDSPGWEMLEPEKTYHLLRDPKELEKSVDTWNGLPLLWIHKGTSAEDHPFNIVVGATGTKAHFDNPDLINDLAVWPKYATEAVEDGEKKSLSCGYGYKAVMEPGNFQGHHFDGRMTDITGNHVAMVDQPRVPGAKVGGDSLPDSDVIWHDLAAAILEATI